MYVYKSRTQLNEVRKMTRLLHVELIVLQELRAVPGIYGPNVGLGSL